MPAGLERTSRLGTVLYVWNYRDHAPKPGSWSFAFDTSQDFPEELFEELATIFPMLYFDCECIDLMDDFMGYGWFNIPPGGEAFRQNMAVPKDYWTGGGGFKRKPDAQRKYQARERADAGRTASRLKRRGALVRG